MTGSPPQTPGRRSTWMLSTCGAVAMSGSYRGVARWDGVFRHSQNGERAEWLLLAMGHGLLNIVQVPAQVPFSRSLSLWGHATYVGGSSASQAECRRFEPVQALHSPRAPLRVVAPCCTNSASWLLARPTPS